MSCFHVSAQLRVCSSRALSRLRALFHIGAWFSNPGTHVLSFGFVSGFGYSRSMFCLVVWPCSLEFAQPRTLLSMCQSRAFLVILCFCKQFVFLSAACIHVMSCVFHWLRAFMLSCLVRTHGL